ncbi:MAG: hypothetical protein P8Z30_16615 [Acidobacteriota bacterium]
MGFDSFLGNAKAVQAIREMLARERVPGSLLFTGPEGVGKKTLAIMLARALNCERRGPKGDDFCGECSRCRKAGEFLASGAEDLARRRGIKDAQKRVEGLVYFDLQVIEPLTRYILIEQIRQLRATAYSSPFNFPQRVLIVDQAQAIHWQAADLLLKVLEEPPETTTIILVCSNAYELRPTIRSRCLTVQFSPAEETAIRRLLAEERGLAQADLELALRVVNGSIALAKTLQLKEYQELRKPWLNLLDAVSRPAGRPLSPPQWKALFDTTRLLAEGHGRLEESLRTGSVVVRDLMHVFLNPESPAVTNIDVLGRLKAWATALGMAGIEKLEDGIESSYRQQIRNVNQQLAFDSVAAELIGSGRRP